MKKPLDRIAGILVAMLLIWIILSFFDIAADNNTTAEHSDWNIITILLEMGN